MPDDHIKAEISAYLLGGLTEARNRQIEAHAAACEKCQQALNKARAKQARYKREALKKASPDPLPNLFLARQGKETGADRPSSGAPWLLAGILLFAVGGYTLFKHYATGPRVADSPIREPESASVAVSSAPVASPATNTVASTAAVPNTPNTAKPPEPSESPETDKTLQVEREWRGVDGGIQTARLVVIRNDDAWAKLWTEMQEKEALPPIDFSQQVIVGIFAGESAGGATITLGRIRETDKEVVVPYQVSSPKGTALGPQTPTHPYLLSLLPRRDKKIRLTQWGASE